MNVFPIYLNRLNDKRTIVIGGDDEAERKVNELLFCKANVTVIGPALNNNLQIRHAKDHFQWISRNYMHGDLKGAFLVIVADYGNTKTQEIFEEADNLGILINVMDDIPHCNFTFGSMVKRGPLTISISTSGAAPTMAVRLRERFENEFGEEYESLLKFMKALRNPVKNTFPDFKTRKQKWYKLVDSGILDYYRQNDLDKVYERASSIMGKEVVQKALNLLMEESG